jgi:uncharacterized membrane protein
MTLSPAITVHIVFAVGALALGPLALAARKGSRLHRASGYIWVTLMLGTAISSVFIRDFRLPNLLGYTPIHLFSVLAIAGVAGALVQVARGNIAGHRKTMRRTYIGACIAGLFALLPSRFVGDWLWHQTLGLM